MKMSLTGYKVLVIFWLLMANFKACPRKQVAEDSQWISRPEEDTQGSENQAEQEDGPGEFQKEGFRDQERNLPQDLQELTNLLEAVVGTHNEEYYDPHFDKVTPQ